MFDEPERPTADIVDPADPYTPVALAKRHNGWTAARQRRFLENLAETGSISLACTYAGVSSRSAYRLRARPDAAAFAKAWDEALKLAALRLMTLAFERATRGGVRETWREDHLVASVRAPSDRMLIYLLDRMLPAGETQHRWAGFETMVDAAKTSFPRTLETLADNAVAMVPIESRDYFDTSPGDSDEDC
jgi:hypothetical protein